MRRRPIKIVRKDKINFYRLRKAEYNAVVKLLELLDDVTTTYDEQLVCNGSPIYINHMPIYFPYDDYNYIEKIPKQYVIFKPLSNETHANMIIDMFDVMNIIQYNNIIITQNVDNPNKYDGTIYLSNGREITVINQASAQILKLMLVAKAAFNREDYKEFYSYVKDYYTRKE